MITTQSINNIINTYINTSKFLYPFINDVTIEVQNSSVNVVFSNIKIEKYIYQLNDEIKRLYSELEVHTTGRFIQFIFKNAHVRIWNEPIDFPFYISFIESHINVYIDKASHIETIKLKRGNFFNCTFDNLSILLGPKENKNIKNIEIDLIGHEIKMLQFQHIHFANSESNIFNIENCTINRITFWKVVSDIDVSFNMINSQLSTMQEQLRFMECSFNSRFFLINSYFNTTLELNGVSFNGDTSFKNLHIKTTDFDKAFFSKDINLEVSDLHISDVNNISRSTFREIKQKLEESGNKIDANRFHSYELMAKRKELKQEGLKLNNILDHITFWMNEKVSNHGLNWALPLFWMLFIGFFYSGYFFSPQLKIDEIAVLSATLTLSIILLFSETFVYYSKKVYLYVGALVLGMFFYFYMHNGWEYLIRFISIVDFSNNIDNIEFVDRSFSKIIMLYLTYHFITALRKDTRK